MISGYLDPLAPMHFFILHHTVPYLEKGKEIPMGKKYQLPSTESFLGEDHFAKAYASWNELGIKLRFIVSKPFETAVYPQFTQGDAIELFVDTRDLKDTGFATRFCHHFLILPQEVQGVRALELSRFRAEDSHPLCEPDLIITQFMESSKEYFLDITLTQEVLYGFDPTQFDKLGFTYTVHRPKGKPQHFTLSSSYVAIASNPSMWSSCHLAK